MQQALEAVHSIEGDSSRVWALGEIRALAGVGQTEQARGASSRPWRPSAPSKTPLDRPRPWKKSEWSWHRPLGLLIASNGGGDPRDSVEYAFPGSPRPLQRGRTGTE